MREKDVAFASALIEAALADVDTPRSRVPQLPDDLDGREAARIAAFLEHAS